MKKKCESGMKMEKRGDKDMKKMVKTVKVMEKMKPKKSK
jgi:hypothetical protein